MAAPHLRRTAEPVGFFHPLLKGMFNLIYAKITPHALPASCDATMNGIWGSAMIDAVSEML